MHGFFFRGIFVKSVSEAGAGSDNFSRTIPTLKGVFGVHPAPKSMYTHVAHPLEKNA